MHLPSSSGKQPGGGRAGSTIISSDAGNEINREQEQE